jgi:TetR/AcrR family transcriptional regulator, transcriptional repressor for nem operon
MRYPQDHLQRTRERILHCARQRFATTGFAGTSIEDVMADCGLTRGGFYRHFRSKDALYALAMARDGDATPHARRSHAMAEHLEQALRERPLSHLAADAVSESSAVRAVARRRFEALVSGIRAQLQADGAAARGGEPALLAATAMMLGALALAQSERNAGARRGVLTVCAHAADGLLEPPGTAEAAPYFWMPATAPAVDARPYGSATAGPGERPGGRPRA